MKLNLKRLATVSLFLCGLLVISGATSAGAQPGPPAGPRSLPQYGNERDSLAAGAKAALTCSSTFIAGRPLQEILYDELAQQSGQGDDILIDMIPDPVVNRGTRSVSVKYAQDSPPRVSVYREGFGCTLLPPGWTARDASRLPDARMPAPSGDASQIPWPNGDRLPNGPLPSGVDVERLNGIVEAAFDSETYGPNSKTVGVVVVHDGRLVAEKYMPGFDKDTQYRTWSTAKSFANALVGVMVREGKLDVNEPAPIPEWQSPDDPRKDITVDDLLHMSSGLDTVMPEDGSTTIRAYYGGIDTAQDVVRRPLKTEPGTRFHYSNYDVLLLMRVIKEVIGSEEEYLTFPKRELFDKIGMRSTVAETDPYGNFIMSSQVYTTARDLARFGLLYLNDGVWDGERILPEGWVEFTEKPAPARKDGYAGALFWRMKSEDLERASSADLPPGIFYTSGWRGQHAVVVPSHDLVVVRTGLDSTEHDFPFYLEDFVSDVISTVEPEEGGNEAASKSESDGGEVASAAVTSDPSASGGTPVIAFGGSATVLAGVFGLALLRRKQRAGNP